MRLISRLGNGLAWSFLCLLFIIIGLLQEGEITTNGEVSTGIALSLGSLIQILLQLIIKRIFNRERPYVKHEDISKAIKPPDRFSFPSGHTAGAFTVSFVLYYYHPFISIPFFILSGLIAFSRMYLGVHYLSDILAGIVLGFISSILGIYLSLLISI
jgi:undecaprenyl-diphosphatase